MKATDKVRAALPIILEMKQEGAARYTAKQIAARAGCSPGMVNRIMANLPKIVAQVAL